MASAAELMEHPGGQPPTPCAPHASYAGMRACARCAGAPAAPPPLARGITQCGAPSRSVPRQGAKFTDCPEPLNHPNASSAVISVVRPRLRWCSPRLRAAHIHGRFRSAAQHVRTHTAPAYASAPTIQSPGTRVQPAVKLAAENLEHCEMALSQRCASKCLAAQGSFLFLNTSFHHDGG